MRKQKKPNKTNGKGGASKCKDMFSGNALERALKRLIVRILTASMAEH